jgi:hypothetical protein
MKVKISEDNSAVIIEIEDTSEYGTYIFYSAILDDEIFQHTFNSIGVFTIPFSTQTGEEYITDVVIVETPGEERYNLFAYKAYQDCFLKQVINSSFDTCGKFDKINCSDCDEESLITFSTLIKGIQVAETLNEVEAALTIYGYIDEFYNCEHGCGCNEIIP